MKKRFISLVAAAALVGGIASVATPAANAGTVAVKGDTAVNMYGFIRFEAGSSSDMLGNTFYSNVPEDTDAKKRYVTRTNLTRIGFTFKNADANVSGRIEGDFAIGSFRLRRAYVKHSFDNFYALIGQEWEIEEINTFSAAWISPAGFNGATRIPQIQLGSTFDLGGANLTAKLAFEDISFTAEKSRKTFPGIGLYLGTNFDTGFGAPAKVYAWGLATPMKVIYNVGVGEKSKTPVGFGAGFVVPVSMVTLQGEYIYGKGMNGLAGSDLTPASYNANGDAQKFYAWNAEAKISPMSCMSLAAGYDYLKFKGDNGYKMYTIFANLSYKTTKYTKLTVEWDHAKIKDGDKGDRYFLQYNYSF